MLISLHLLKCYEYYYIKIFNFLLTGIKFFICGWIFILWFFYSHPRDKRELVTGELFEVMVLNVEGIPDILLVQNSGMTMWENAFFGMMRDKNNVIPRSAPDWTSRNLKFSPPPISRGDGGVKWCLIFKWWLCWDGEL